MERAPGTGKMPKVKTNKTAAKRFKISASGKFMFERSHLNHLMMCKKDGGRARRMKQEGEVFKGEVKKTRRLLPNSL
jgi:large subunit ribosomal protein L35